jgi:CcmD family protein
MSSMGFLFSAYSAIWVILAIYLYSIHAREKKLRSEVERLKHSLESKNGKL